MPVRWYGNRLQDQLNGAEEQILRKAAFQCLAHAKVNIVGNDQVDTGFMLNSGYVVTQGQSSYGQLGANTDGHEKAPERSAGKAKAIVAFAANYAIFQEAHKTFLFKALEQTERDLPQIIKVERIK